MFEGTQRGQRSKIYKTYIRANKFIWQRGFIELKILNSKFKTILKYYSKKKTNCAESSHSLFEDDAHHFPRVEKRRQISLVPPEEVCSLVSHMFAQNLFFQIRKQKKLDPLERGHQHEEEAPQTGAEGPQHLKMKLKSLENSCRSIAIINIQDYFFKSFCFI